MPLMAPLSDLVGVSRQTAVLAFQMGDGFTNMIIPTSAVLMGALALAGVPWQKWARWVLPLQIGLFVLGSSSSRLPWRRGGALHRSPPRCRKLVRGLHM